MVFLPPRLVVSDAWLMDCSIRERVLFIFDFSVEKFKLIFSYQLRRDEVRLSDEMFLIKVLFR